MHFGMGCSCLQITYETHCMNHARYLYDMFIPFTPIASALSQCTPFAKGKLSSNDFRFKILEQSVDCRTPEERDPNSPFHLQKSRYSPVNTFKMNAMTLLKLKYSRKSWICSTVKASTKDSLTTSGLYLYDLLCQPMRESLNLRVSFCLMQFPRVKHLIMNKKSHHLQVTKRINQSR